MPTTALLFRHASAAFWPFGAGEEGIMSWPREILGRQALKYAMAGIAATCLGAAVIAAPMAALPKAKYASPARQMTEAKAYAALGKGPAFQLQRAEPGEDEDCVKVTRIVGPDGRIYVTRGLVCQE
jgi:hypothetical protein